MTIKLLKIDQTEYWCEAIKNRVKRIFGVYIFDSDKCVHCCEITPSYECLFIGSQVDFLDNTPEDEFEKIEDEIGEGDFQTEMFSYFHCFALDNAPKFELGYFPEEKLGVAILSGLLGDSSEEQIDEAVEFVRRNGI